MFTEPNWLLNIHCANHLVELALKDTVKEAAFQEVDNLYNLIYFSLKNSGETKSEIKEASNALNIQHCFLSKLTDTRYVGHRRNTYSKLLKGVACCWNCQRKYLYLFLIMFSTKVNLLYLLYLITQRCFLLHLINQNYLLITFLRTLILMTQVSLYLFSPLELIWNCIIFLFLVLKNYEPTFSYILAEFFNICLKEPCFPDCWKVSVMVPVFKSAGKRSTANNCCPVSLLSLVSKIFEKLVNNRIVDPLEKCGEMLISSMVLGLVDQL